MCIPKSSQHERVPRNNHKEAWLPPCLLIGTSLIELYCLKMKKTFISNAGTGYIDLKIDEFIDRISYSIQSYVCFKILKLKSLYK